eukprot:1151385-Pelagomonas_calceolata.AAC.3
MQTSVVLSRQLLGMAFLGWKADSADSACFEGLEIQSFSYHPALFLVAGPIFFLCLPCFSQSELRGLEAIQSVHQCGPLSLIDVGITQ